MQKAPLIFMKKIGKEYIKISKRKRIKAGAKIYEDEYR